MGRKKAPAEKALLHEIKTRVNEKKFKELQSLLSKNPNNDMSRLVRDILHNRTIKVYTRDMTLDNLMEELARIRAEIRFIGININQITKSFHTYKEPVRQAYFAKVAFEKYEAVQPKIEILLEIISKLSKRWLSE
jgi:hypothetical protein